MLHVCQDDSQSPKINTSLSGLEKFDLPYTANDVLNDESVERLKLRIVMIL